jgi:hypothetical protein
MGSKKRRGVLGEVDGMLQEMKRNHAEVLARLNEQDKFLAKKFKLSRVAREAPAGELAGIASSSAGSDDVENIRVLASDVVDENAEETAENAETAEMVGSVVEMQNADLEERMKTSNATLQSLVHELLADVARLKEERERVNIPEAGESQASASAEVSRAQPPTQQRPNFGQTSQNTQGSNLLSPPLLQQNSSIAPQETGGFMHNVQQQQQQLPGQTTLPQSQSQQQHPRSQSQFGMPQGFVNPAFSMQQQQLPGQTTLPQSQSQQQHPRSQSQFGMPQGIVNPAFSMQEQRPPGFGEF